MKKGREHQYTFFGEHKALEALSQKGDRLEELDRHIDFAPLVEIADRIWRPATAKGPGGRPRWSSEVMLRVLLLKRLYNLSDEQTEFQLRDRLSFLRFVRLGLGDEVPDSRTVWVYNETLKKADGARQLFEAFNAQLAVKGLQVDSGVLVDAAIVAVPRQRNKSEENAQIKEGLTPPSWSAQPNKLAHKDVDARWTRKYYQNHYGYKNHIKTGETTKLIRDYVVTPANAADGLQLPSLVRSGDRRVHADSAYFGQPIATYLATQGVENLIHEKGQKNQPLTEIQEESNRVKSRTRARTEHPFAFMQKSLGGLFHRCIGLPRAVHQIGLLNLAYNLCRAVQLLRVRT